MDNSGGKITWILDADSGQFKAAMGGAARTAATTGAEVESSLSGIKAASAGAANSMKGLGATVTSTSKENSSQISAFSNIATGNFRSLTGAVDDSEGVIKKVQASAKGAIGPITLMGDAANGTGDAFINSAGSVEKSGSRIGNILQSATTRILAYTAAYSAMRVGVAILAGSVGTFAKYDSEMGILAQVTGATAAQMKMLGDNAVKLGKDISLPSVSAADAARAQLELAKAGLSVNDVMAASKGVLSLATAGQIDVGMAANATAQALNAFGLKGQFATSIADELAAASNASTATVNDLQLGLSMVGSGAHEMGVSLQDTITALAIFNNAGIKGSDAGTSLKQMFIQLNKPTKDATAELNKLGIKVYDQHGAFVGLSNLADQLKNKLSGLTVEQKNYALTTIFGSDASRVAGVLAANGAKGFDTMSVSVGKAGSAAALAAAANHGIAGSLSALTSNLQTVGLQFGKFLSGALKPVIDLANHNLPAAMAASAAAIAGMVLAIILLTTQLTLANIAADILAGTLGALQIIGIGLAFAAVAAIVVILVEKFHLIQVIGGVLGPIFKDIGMFLKLIFDTITGGTPGLDAAGTKFATIGKILDGVAGIFAKMYRIIGAQLTSAFNSLGVIFDSIHQAFKPFIDAVVDFYKRHAPAFHIALKVLGVALLALATPILPFLATVTALAAGLFVAAHALKFLADHMTTVIHIGHDIIAAFGMIMTIALWPLNKAMNALGVDWHKILGAMVSVVTWLKDEVVKAFNLMSDPVNLAKRLFGDFVFYAKAIFTGIADVISAPFIWAFDTISAGWKIVSDAVSAATSAIAGFFKAMFDAVAGWIKDHLKLLENIGIVLLTIVAPKLVALGIQYGILAAKAIASAVTSAAQWVASAAVTSAAWLVEMAKIIAQFAVTAVQSSIQAIKTGAVWVAQASVAAAKWVVTEMPRIIASFVLTSAQATINAVKTGAVWVAQAAVMAARFALTFAIMIAGFVAVGVQALITAAKVALSWMLALGPIGLIIAAVAGIAALIITNWDTVKGWMTAFWGWFTNLISGVIDWVKTNWPLILAVLTGPIGLAVLAIVKNWDTIKQAFSDVVSFLAGVFSAAWDGIVAVWNAAGAFFQSVWDGIVLVFSTVAGWIVNFFQMEWNGIVNIWNWLGTFFQNVWNGVVAVFNAVIGFIVTFFQNEWNGIVNIWNAVAGFFQGVWNGITGIFANVAGWFADRFTNAYNNIKNVFSGLWGFFKGVWDNIVGLFSNVGTSVGNAIGNTFKSVINTVLSGAVKIINTFIGAINGAIGAINKLPGVNIGKLGTLAVPQLAAGGIINPKDGGTLVNVAEKGQAEAVVPLGKLNDMIRTAVSSAQAPMGYGQAAAPTTIENHIGTINIASEVEAENWLQKLTRQDEITATGLTT